MWQSITTGMLLGLMSSFHCIGMCGPLALTLPLHQQKKGSKYRSWMLYQGGRIATYAILGLIAGFTGWQISLMGWQNGLSITSGSLMLIAALYGLLGKKVYTPVWLRHVHVKIITAMGKLMQQSSLAALAGLGMLNGLLPCGMVYVALAGAWSAPVPSQSVVYMLSFGGATLPGLALATGFGWPLSFVGKRKIQKFMPVLVGCVGLLLILRGLHLDIPIVSPAMVKSAQTVSCH